MPNDDVPEVSAEEASTLVSQGALLLDVREPDEWQAGHAPDAIFLPIGQVEARIDELPRDRQILAICRVGGRLAAVVAALNTLGYDAVNVAGGMRAWESDDLPVIADDGLPGAVI
jgi:rhodanese-related sulfurtransferase